MCQLLLHQAIGMFSIVNVTLNTFLGPRSVAGQHAISSPDDIRAFLTHLKKTSVVENNGKNQGFSDEHTLINIHRLPAPLHSKDYQDALTLNLRHKAEL